jgi:hypothetical protein
MRQILLASEESHERPALLSNVIADRATQSGIAGFERIEHRTLGHRTGDFKLNLATNLRQRSQMRRQYDADENANHGSV